MVAASANYDSGSGGWLYGSNMAAVISVLAGQWPRCCPVWGLVLVKSRP
jgi:hypothetical protein